MTTTETVKEVFNFCQDYSYIAITGVSTKQQVRELQGKEIEDETSEYFDHIYRLKTTFNSLMDYEEVVFAFLVEEDNYLIVRCNS